MVPKKVENDLASRGCMIEGKGVVALFVYLPFLAVLALNLAISLTCSYVFSKVLV